MNDLNAQHFGDFFHALHDHDPFPWQKKLAQRACAGDWPQVIDLPTASGKTACLDIALFALAVKSNGPRRIFFVVDRRIIVDDAFQRMQKVAYKLKKAETGVLASVAGALRNLANSASPLSVYQLRGGVYRDQSWIRTPLQPTVITSTVDQVGSRLLFRGYGVSENSAPVHAALIANDSLIFLDEAHCSRAFSQTLSSVHAYCGGKWAKSPLNKRFSFVEMTATPSRTGGGTFRLDAADQEDELLARRLYAAKPTTLHLVKGRAKDRETLALNLAEQAFKMAKDSAAGRIAVMVNRVATARRVHELLGKRVSPENLHLLIGRMRPVDRDGLVEGLKTLKAGTGRHTGAPPTFVVSTQCLEVGADLDFDILVTECASIDALLQRFGRLDRLGDLGGNARGCILTLSGAVESKEPDPIYGYCLAETWRWLTQVAGPSNQLNLGIESLDLGLPTVGQSFRSLPEEEATKLRRLGQDAPALLPAHLDALVQTSPKPHAEPDVPLFLHGRADGPREILVVWRKDLNDVPIESWKKIVALCPPVSAEAMPVRLDDFRRWLTGYPDASSGDDSDLEGTGKDEAQEGEQRPHSALVWHGDESKEVEKASDIRPNAVVVLSLKQQGWQYFGHIPIRAPDVEVEDVAEEAIREARGQIIFRINEKIFGSNERLWPASIVEKLKTLVRNEEFDWDAWEELVARHRDFFVPRGIISGKQAEFKPPIPYPAKESETPQGWVLQLRKKDRLAQQPLDEDAGDDSLSRTDTPTSLEKHTQDVKRAVESFAVRLLPDFVETLAESARLHDSGKADQRFQAMLHGGDHLAAAYAPEPLAKGNVLSSGLNKAARQKSGLPPKFRHELASLHFAAKQCLYRADREWILHLIAGHHGYCRPFAPVVLETDCPEICWEELTISASERQTQPAHHLASGVARRFWRFTREFGWWGSAYLESCLRLADWAASKAEQKGESL